MHNNFQYPKKIIHPSLDMVTEHHRGRDFSSRFFFFHMRLLLDIKALFLGKTSFIHAYWRDDYETAFKLAWEHVGKHPVATSLVGHMLLGGVGCEKNIEQGIHWTRVAAEQGEPVAMGRHAYRVKEKDPQLAYRLFLDSFASGNEYAAIGLLEMVSEDENLITVQFNDHADEAIKVLKNSASIGFPPAQKILERLQDKQWVI